MDNNPYEQSVEAEEEEWSPYYDPSPLRIGMKNGLIWGFFTLLTSVLIGLWMLMQTYNTSDSMTLLMINATLQGGVFLFFSLITGMTSSIVMVRHTGRINTGVITALMAVPWYCLVYGILALTRFIVTSVFIPVSTNAGHFLSAELSAQVSLFIFLISFAIILCCLGGLLGGLMGYRYWRRHWEQLWREEHME